MSKNKEPFLKLVVAALPMLSKTIFFRNAFFLGGVIAAAFWLTESFFAVTHAWFPVRLRGTAKVFWVAAMVQISQTLAGVTPLWGIGLWLLLFRHEKDQPQGKIFPASDIFWIGLGFWVLMAYLGMAQEMFGGRMSFLIFRHPAGSFLLLALAALGWKHPRPAEKIR